jgi:Ser/Thr protein kinase RdoA (MazF antagonist)
LVESTLPTMENRVTMSIPQFTEIAHRALDKYNLSIQDVSYLQHSENVTFKITTSDQSYLLRLHLPLTKGMGTHGLNPEVIRSEMLWVDSLHRNKLPVPRSVRNRSGELVTQVKVVHGKPVNCTVLEWLEGDLYAREMESEDNVAQIGNLVGRIHLHASRWRLPRGFQRPKRDASYFMDVLTALQPAVEDGRINYHDFKTLQSSIEGLAGMIQPGRKTRDLVGLLHGDLHRGNFLNHNGEIRLIDFSLCALGYFTYDLGTCLSNINPALHEIFLVNYSRVIPLPMNYERLVEGFFIASYAVTFSFWLDNPDAQETLAQRVPYLAQEFAARFNRDERFWFKT